MKNISISKLVFSVIMLCLSGLLGWYGITKVAQWYATK